MRHFIVSDDKNIVGKMGLELADQGNNKLSLVKLKFSYDFFHTKNDRK